MADLKFRLNMEEISNSIVYYYIKEDILEKENLKLVYPNFSNKMDRIQKRYLKLQKYFFSQNQQLMKSKNTIFQNFLLKFTQTLISSIVDVIVRKKLYEQPITAIQEELIKHNKKDAEFFEIFCGTQLFDSFVERLKKMSGKVDLEKFIMGET